MNKFDFLQKIEEAETLIASARYDEAVEICDELNLDLVKEPRKLQNLAKAYEKCKRFRDAEKLLSLAHEQVPRSRGVLFHLCNVAVKAGNVRDAKGYYNDFCELVPRDARRHILAYRIAVAEKQPDDELISILEKYLGEETDDRWMYVLAELYAKQGRTEECAGVCNAIVLWFDSGRYVMKARNLLTSLGYDVPDEADEFYDEEAEAEYSAIREEEAAPQEQAAPETVPEEVVIPAEPEAEAPAQPEEIPAEEVPENVPEIIPEEVPESTEEQEPEAPAPKEKKPEPVSAAEAAAKLAAVVAVAKGEKHARDLEKAAGSEEIVIPDLTEETLEEKPEETPEKAGEESPEPETPEQEPEEEHVIMTITDPGWNEKIRGEAKADEFETAPEFAIDLPDEMSGNETILSGKSEEERRQEAEARIAAAEAQEKAEKAAKADEIRAEIRRQEHEAAVREAEQADEQEPEEGQFETVEYGAALNRELSRRKDERQPFGALPVEPQMSEDIWHFIAFGETDEYSLACAKEHIREISEENSNCPSKMLKISAEKIGTASIINSLDRFLGNVVVVEHISLLSDEQLTEFAKVLDTDDMSLLVVFTDTKEGILNALKRVPQLERSFTAVYEGRDYTPDDLLEIAENYLRTEEARFSPEAEELVKEYAEELLSDKRGFYRNHILDYVGQALDFADMGGFLGFGAGKMDRDGTLIVDAKHFRKAEKE